MVFPDGRTVVYVTPNLQRVMSWSQEEIVPGLQRIDQAMDTAEIREFVRRLLTMGLGESAGPVIRERLHPLTGERQYLLEQAVCVRIQDEVKVVVCISDQTRSFKLRAELVDALRRVQDANNVKSAFLKSVSHDMRTPMNAIIGFLGLMRGEVNNPDRVMEYNQQIDVASQHLLGLINKVLDMSKIENGGVSLNISELSVGEIVEEIRTIVMPQIQAKHQTFEISVAPLKHELLQEDRVRVEEILLNLLSNAMKYTPAGGTISLRVAELPQVMNNFSRIRFEVKDNGAGISKEYQSLLFNPFSREDTQINLEQDGTGLGLAIAKSLLDVMGGDIRVKSDLGKGSIFTVELDMRILDNMIAVGDDEEDCRSEKAVSDATSDVIRGKHILIVDDIEINRIVLSKIMSSLGASCDTAANGQEALEMFERSRPGDYDLILMDLQMPVLDGFGATRAIRSCDHPAAKSIPIVAVTANAFSDDVRAAMDAGMNAHLAKPVRADKLKLLIQQVLEGQVEGTAKSI